MLSPRRPSPPAVVATSLQHRLVALVCELYASLFDVPVHYDDYAAAEYCAQYRYSVALLTPKNLAMSLSVCPSWRIRWAVAMSCAAWTFRPRCQQCIADYLADAPAGTRTSSNRNVETCCRAARADPADGNPATVGSAIWLRAGRPHRDGQRRKQRIRRTHAADGRTPNPAGLPRGRPRRDRCPSRWPGAAGRAARRRQRKHRLCAPAGQR